MHIPDGALPIRQCLLYWLVVAPFIAFYILKLRRLDEEAGGRHVAHTAAVATFVFAITLFEIPTPVGIPFHLLMIPFAAIALGPLSGVLVSFLCLLFQFMLAGEGGFTTLGANTLVMGVCCSFPAVLSFKLLRDINEKVGIFSGAFLGVLTAAVVNALILAAAGVLPLNFILPFNVAVYSVEGALEGVITVLMMDFLRRVGFRGVEI